MPINIQLKQNYSIKKNQQTGLIQGCLSNVKTEIKKKNENQKKWNKKKNFKPQFGNKNKKLGEKNNALKVTDTVYVCRA